MTAGGGARGVLFLVMLWASACDAAVFPRRPRSHSTGARDAVYMKLRGVNDRPLASFQINQIRELEDQTRRFYAANSGGQFDISFDHILDVPLTLNDDGTRPDDWFDLAETYVRSNYGVEPNDYYADLFDVSGTEPDPGQGWSGIAVSPGNNVALQAGIDTDWGMIVMDHELGHRVGAPHSGAYRNLNDGNWTPYVWNEARRRYDVYSSSTHGLQPTAFGIHLDEYGNPFSVMGNISHEHFTVVAKHGDFGWLTDEQVPELSDLGEGTYRIYAHNELEVAYDEASDNYGVEETYEANKLYGLRYTRRAERFNASTGRFEPYNQELTLEYRSGREGVQFYLGEGILDMDLDGGTNRSNTERELEVGQSISDLDFATSVFYTSDEGEDFLSYNPPAPSDPWDLSDQWFTFTVLGTSSDEVGSYVELSVSRITLNPDGDYNNDGVVDAADYTVWRDNLGAPAGTLPNDPAVGPIGDDQYATWRANYGAASASAASASVAPEPGTLALLALAVPLSGVPWRERRQAP